MAVGACLALVALASPHRVPPTLYVDEAVPISEPHRAFVEPFVVADPTEGRRLLVSVSQISPRSGVVGRVFISNDSGFSWQSPDISDVRTAVETGRLNGIEDMWASIGSRGTMYVSMLALHAPGPAKNTDPWGPVPVLIVRSEDHGAHWSTPTVIRTRSADAPKMAVWRDSVVVVVVQVNAGDTVVHAPSDGNEYVAVYRSTDGARTFEAPRLLAFDDLGHNPLNPVFLSDGTLLVAWMDHPHYGRGGADQHLSDSRIWVIRSSDGGRTFAIPHVVADVQRVGFPSVLRMIVDDGVSSPYRGRVYVIWNGGSGAHTDVSLASSDDGGRHWTESKHVTSGEGADVFTAAATNRDGVFALVWGHHASDATTTPCYVVNITASNDGAESFARPRLLADAPVCPDAPANKAIEYPFYGRRDSVSSSWRHGGDYIGMTASVDGTFHPVWTDTRDGPFRVYTAGVRTRP
jgi:hypothetical protein